MGRKKQANRLKWCDPGNKNCSWGRDPDSNNKKRNLPYSFKKEDKLNWKLREIQSYQTNRPRYGKNQTGSGEEFPESNYDKKSLIQNESLNPPVIVKNNKRRKKAVPQNQTSDLIQNEAESVVSPEPSAIAKNNKKRKAVDSPQNQTKEKAKKPEKSEFYSKFDLSTEAINQNQQKQKEKRSKSKSTTNPKNKRGRAKNNDDDDFSLEYDNVEFGEVAERPPALAIKPKSKNLQLKKTKSVPVLKDDKLANQLYHQQVKEAYRQARHKKDPNLPKSKEREKEKYPQNYF